MRAEWGIGVGLLLAASAFAQEPSWLERARAREGDLGRPRKVRAPDDWFMARVPARLVDAVAKDEDEDYALNFDIGADAPIECLVLRESNDPPAFLRAVSDSTIELLAGRVGALEAKAIEAVDAGAIGDAIFMSVDWLFRATAASGGAIGEVHLAYAVKQDAAIYCAKSELGYTQTFRKLMFALVESFERKDAPPAAHFTEILVASVRGKRVGVGIGTVRRDEAGDRKEEQSLHILLPATSDTLTASSSYDLEWTAGDDLSLLNAVSVESANGEITTELSLRSSEDGRWRVAGKFGGKDFAADLAAGRVPSSNLASLKALRDALASSDAQGRVVTSWEWTDADPGRLIESKATIREIVDGERANVSQTLGPLTADMVVERATGQMLRGTMTTGPVTIEFDRVYVDGRP